MAIPVVVRDTDLGIEYGESAAVLRWLKNVGDTVASGEPLLEVESAKAIVVIEAPAAGILGSILVSQGQEWEISKPVAYILEPGEPQPDEALLAPAVVEPPRQEKPDEPSKTRHPLPMTGMRRTIAERMQKGWQAAPRVTLSAEADVAKTMAMRRAHSASGPQNADRNGISYTAILVKSAARALRLIPLLNAAMEDGQIWLYDNIDIGVAIEVQDGLVVPVVRQADQKDLSELSEEIKLLREQALAEILQPNQMIGATFTVTNLGMYGIEFFTPAINPPSCAILGVGAIKERPTVRNGQVVSCPTIPLSLSFDHRVVDGAPAARFISEIKNGLENPDLLC